MNIYKSVKVILESSNVYNKLLEDVSEEVFQQTPAEGVWSYSEVFSHIFQANITSLIAIENCVHNNAKEIHKATNWKVKLILFFGRFPPGKFKAPAEIAEFTKKINREEAHNLIAKFKNRIQSIDQKIKKSSSTQKYKHPRLGYLNAKQWLRFIEIHIQHHQKQLGRIEKQLKDK